MRSRTATIILATVTVLLAAQIYYLKRLPGSLVKVYSTAEIDDFNRPPTQEFTVTLGGTLFDYRIPHKIEQHAFKEVAASVAGSTTDNMVQAIAVARWVRARMSFGERDYSALEIEAEDILATQESGGLHGWCDLYSRLFVIACQALAIPARIIELDGHVVPEAFIGDLNRWVMIDSTFGYYVISGGKPLSVVELIRCYREGSAFSPVVFVEVKEDDCLYSPVSERELKNIYLNGFTVVSNQTIDLQKMVKSIVKQFSLPIAKIQYLDENSTIIGTRERMVRASLAVTGIVWVLVMGLMLLRRR
jgi:hypothetical protein